MRKIFTLAAAMTSLFVLPGPAANAETLECTEITSLPTIIATQGVYCLKSNLTTNITSGFAIRIDTNNVTIDLNGRKLGGAAAGSGTNANGIIATDRKNITIRNGSIRGFRSAVRILQSSSSNSSGHTIENVLADGNRVDGMRIEGDNLSVLNNTVLNTGPTDNDASAAGIRVNEGTGILIKGNFISGVDESSSAWGMFLDELSEVQISENRVFDLRTASQRGGILVRNSDRIAIHSNTVVTDGGTTGVGDFFNSTDVACTENRVNGFTTDFGGCDTNSNNVAF